MRNQSQTKYRRIDGRFSRSVYRILIRRILCSKACFEDSNRTLAEIVKTSESISNCFHDIGMDQAIGHTWPPSEEPCYNQVLLLDSSWRKAFGKQCFTYI